MVDAVSVARSDGVDRTYCRLRAARRRLDRFGFGGDLLTLGCCDSAALFLLCGSVGNLSGEWLVGGIEGKVFSYGLLFLAIALWLRERLSACALCLGLAISFHPIVGIWGLICGIGSEVIARLLRWEKSEQNSATLLRPAAILLVAALPGIVPAAAILGGASPSDVATANYLQVFWRLRHHLDPTEFSAGRYAGYLILFLAWLCLTVVRLGGAL